MIKPRARLVLAAASLSMAAMLALSQTGGAGSAPSGSGSVRQASAEATHQREDIAKHRQMARAHEEAARCLESGENEAVCQQRLRDACKGIAVGRYCGLRHAH